MIDVHYASLTSQGVQHRVFYLDGHPSRYQQGLTSVNRREPVFPFGDSRTFLERSSSKVHQERSSDPEMIQGACHALPLNSTAEEMMEKS